MLPGGRQTPVWCPGEALRNAGRLLTGGIVLVMKVFGCPGMGACV